MPESKGDQEGIIDALGRRLEEHDENRRAVQEELHGFCDEIRKRADELEERVNVELGSLFKEEDDRLQKALNDLREFVTAQSARDSDGLARAIQKAKAELFVMQRYRLTKTDKNAELSVERVFAEEWLDLEKPKSLRVVSVDPAGIKLSFFSALNPDEERVFDEYGLKGMAAFKASLSEGESNDTKEYTLTREKEGFRFAPAFVDADTRYKIRVKEVFQGKESEWSDEAELVTQEFNQCCIWKECPECPKVGKRYFIDESSPRVAMNVSKKFCTIIGNTALPPNKVTSWSVKILNSKWNDGRYTYVGVAPADIDQSSDYNHMECGWYFDCYDSTLCSGHPHKYWNRKYGPRKESNGEYVHTGDTIGSVMDTAKGELSFVVGGANLGVAYAGIPLDKPLVPCVLNLYESDSVEFVIQ